MEQIEEMISGVIKKVRDMERNPLRRQLRYNCFG